MDNDLTMLLSGVVYHPLKLRLATINLSTKFKVSISRCYE